MQQSGAWMLPVQIQTQACHSLSDTSCTRSPGSPWKGQCWQSLHPTEEPPSLWETRDTPSGGSALVEGRAFFMRTGSGVWDQTGPWPCREKWRHVPWQGDTQIAFQPRPSGPVLESSGEGLGEWVSEQLQVRAPYETEGAHSMPHRCPTLSAGGEGLASCF